MESFGSKKFQISSTGKKVPYWKAKLEIAYSFMLKYSKITVCIMINFYFYIAVLFLSMNKAILIPFAAKEHKSNENNS